MVQSLLWSTITPTRVMRSIPAAGQNGCPLCYHYPEGKVTTDQRVVFLSRHIYIVNRSEPTRNFKTQIPVKESKKPKHHGYVRNFYETGPWLDSSDNKF